MNAALGHRIVAAPEIADAAGVTSNAVDDWAARNPSLASTERPLALPTHVHE